MKRCLVLLVALGLGCTACGQGADAVTAYYEIGHAPAGGDWGITKVNLHLFFGEAPSCDDVLDMQTPTAQVYLEPKIIDDMRFKAKEASYRASGWTDYFDQKMPELTDWSCDGKFDVSIQRSPMFEGAAYTPSAHVADEDDALVGMITPMTIGGVKG